MTRNLFMRLSPNPFVSSPISETLLNCLSGARPAAGNLVLLAVWPVVQAGMFLFILFLLRLLARRDWLAVGLFVLFLVSSLYYGNWQDSVIYILQIGLFALAMTRYGLVAFAAGFFAVFVLYYFSIVLIVSVGYVVTG